MIGNLLKKLKKKLNYLFKFKQQKNKNMEKQKQELSRLMPQVPELEEVVLGAILLESESFDLVNAFLKWQHFYKHEHAIVYRIIQSLAEKNSPINILTVSQQLKVTGELEMVGGSYFVSSLTNRIASAANIEYDARVIVEKYLLRRQIEIGQSLINRAYEPSADPFKIMDYGSNELSQLLDGLETKKAKSVEQLKDEVISECEDALISNKSSGIPISIKGLQNLTNGWQPGLIIYAARPSMGKTAGALEFGIHPAKLNIPVLMFSQETSATKLVSRQMSKESFIYSNKIINKSLDRRDLDLLKKSSQSLNNVPLYIDDTPGLSLTAIRSKSYRMVREKGIKLIIIDYLQLMEGEGNTREQEISKISRGLKKLSMELNIPIIALSQLSRQVEGRSDKIPQLSDLRESGAIEQDADMIIFPYRPEYYNIKDYETENGIIPTNGLMLQIVAKNKDGALGEVKCRWIAEYTAIVNWDDKP